MVDLDYRALLTFNSCGTNGNLYKIVAQFNRTNCRKCFFVNRTVQIWNSLTDTVVQSDILKTFKKAFCTVKLAGHCTGRTYTAD